MIWSKRCAVAPPDVGCWEVWSRQPSVDSGCGRSTSGGKRVSACPSHCDDCVDGQCVPVVRRTTHHCKTCNRATGLCEGCPACHDGYPGGLCVERCNPNLCQYFNYATGTCAGGFADCQRCDVVSGVFGYYCPEGQTCISGQCI